MAEECPHCLGAGKNVGIACPGGRPIVLKCLTCGGSGEVDSVRMLWIEAGRVMRRNRVEARRSMREVAEEAGVGIVELSDAEHGTVDPGPIMGKLQAARIRRQGGGRL